MPRGPNGQKDTSEQATGKRVEASEVHMDFGAVKLCKTLAGEVIATTPDGQTKSFSKMAEAIEFATNYEPADTPGDDE